jgi:hypothetical protein
MPPDEPYRFEFHVAEEMDRIRAAEDEALRTVTADQDLAYEEVARMAVATFSDLFPDEMPDADVDELLKRATSWLLAAPAYTFSPKRTGRR